MWAITIYWMVAGFMAPFRKEPNKWRIHDKIPQVDESS